VSPKTAAARTWRLPVSPAVLWTGIAVGVFLAVEAVVEVPFGCAPHECYGVYEPFFKHLDMYAGLLRKDAERGIAGYLERYFYGPRNWAEYLTLLGLEEMLDASRRGRRIYDD